MTSLTVFVVASTTALVVCVTGDVTVVVTVVTVSTGVATTVGVAVVVVAVVPVSADCCAARGSTFVVLPWVAAAGVSPDVLASCVGRSVAAAACTREARCPL